MNRSTPGFPVHHKLPEFTQTHAHWVGDAIQPSHPLSSPSAPAPNPTQHQGLFQWLNSSHEVAEVLEFQLQHQSFQWTPRTDSPKTNHCGDKSLFSNRPTLYGECMVLKGIWENEHLQNIYCVSDTAISTTQNIELVVFQFLFNAQSLAVSKSATWKYYYLLM